MIKASELRVGNWIHAHPNNKDYYKLKHFNEGIGFMEDESMLFFADAVGIPLTTELLEKCGFEKSLSEDVQERTIYGIQVANNTSLYFDPHKDWMRNDYEVEWYLSHEWNNNHFKNDFLAKPKHLHQLQNLYFALTGEELQISL
jgi:hypothetical protein